MRIMKRIMALLIVIAFLGASILPNVSDVRAASIDNAKTISIGQTVSGELSENNQEQYYKFTLNESGKVNISGTAYSEQLGLRIFDNNCKEVYYWGEKWNSTSELIPMNYTFYLNGGTYYYEIDSYRTYYGRGYGKYSFKIDYESANESFNENESVNNDSIYQANAISVNGLKYLGQLSFNEERDFYKLELPESGYINLKATLKMKEAKWKLYNESGEELYKDNLYWNGTTNQIVLDDITYLNKGMYYLVFENNGYSGYYEFSESFTPANESFTETQNLNNDSISSASHVTLGEKYNGMLAFNDSKDFYRFELPESGKIVLNASLKMEWVYWKIYDLSGNELLSNNPKWNSVTNQITLNEIISLDKGTYYLVFESDDHRSGFYNFNLSNLTQDNCPHNEYTSKVHEPTYFAKGYTKYTCKDCGHSYKDKYTAMKVLSQAEIRSDYNSVGKGKLTVGWYTDSDADGYEIKYSLKSSMKNSKTAKVSDSDTNVKTIKKLKRKKKYYVQVRKYKTSGEKTVYSPWSVKYWFKVS